MKEQENRYQKFRESRQEKLRLEIALEEFRKEEGAVGWDAWNEYREYIKKRIRPAAELLAGRGDREGLELLAGWGWITEKLLEELIETALHGEDRAVLFYLLHLKNTTIGFHDRDYLL